MIRPLIALLTTQTYIVALVFTDSGHLRTTLVVTPYGKELSRKNKRHAQVQGFSPSMINQILLFIPLSSVVTPGHIIMYKQIGLCPEPESVAKRPPLWSVAPAISTNYKDRPAKLEYSASYTAFAAFY